MEKEGSYSGDLPAGVDHYSDLEAQTRRELMTKQQMGETSGDGRCDRNQTVDYMITGSQALPPQQYHHFRASSSFDKFSLADVMQFEEFGPKLGLNQAKTCDEEGGIDPIYFLKFPVLNEKLQDDDHHLSLMAPTSLVGNEQRYKGLSEVREDRDEAGVSAEENASVGLRFLGENLEKSPLAEGCKSKKKRPRTLKTSEEVESQRMTHIAVERNRRKQMNEHLRALRSLMPSSYVQRGDQASIIGGAIEFVRELEQLLQCLESQKRRRLYGDHNQRQAGEASLGHAQQPPQVPAALIFSPVAIPNDEVKLVGFESGLQEETAECKSCLADVEVKVVGFDGIIKILSRRRGGQLIKLIAALEDLQLNILHTNITTIEQTVLYSFNVKLIGGDVRFTAEDIANSVQQIFSFIHANSGI